MSRRLKDFLVDSSVLVFFLALAWLVVPTFTRRPWDFETYLLAARAAQAGLNPYDPKSLELMAGRPVGMLFFYPLITLPLFLPFLGLSIPSATAVWLAVKVLAFLFIFHIWRRRFLPTVPLVLSAPAAAFAFNGSVIWDLRTGNIAVLQDLLLWLGFAAYIGGRRALAAAGIVAASIFKLVPIGFLALLLVPAGNVRPSWRIVLVSIAGFLVLVLGAPLTGLAWTPHYLHSLAFGGPWGAANPSALCLVNSLLLRSYGSSLTELSNVGLWLCYVAVLVFVSAFPLHRAWLQRDPTLWVLTLTALFVLLNPRPVAYGYFLAVPAMFTPVGRGISAFRFEAVAFAVGAQAVIGTFVEYKDPWTTNLAFLVLFALWLVYSLWCVRGFPGASASGRAR